MAGVWAAEACLCGRTGREHLRNIDLHARTHPPLAHPLNHPLNHPPIYSPAPLAQGVKEEDAAKVEALVLETLEQLEREGFTQSAVEAAVNTIEFSLRENNTGRFPRGLSLMLRSMSAWIYDRDPFQPLKVREGVEGVGV